MDPRQFLGQGTPPDSRSQSVRHRYASAPSGLKEGFSVESEVDVELTARSAKRRKAFGLTPDNADTVLDSALDIETLSAYLLKNPDAVSDPTRLLAALKSVVNDPQEVSFTDVQPRHLTLLGMDFMGTLHLDNDRVRNANKPDSPSNAVLNNGVMGDIKSHFNLSKEAGCRGLIDQYLLAAALYAQGIIEKDRSMKTRLSKKYKFQDPHIAIFPELQIPATKVSCGDRSYVFHGSLDYSFGFISGSLRDALASGGASISPKHALGGIIEAKSKDDFTNPRSASQIVVQVLTVLCLTDRTFFVGALTNGQTWRFYAAYNGESQLRVYERGDFDAEHNGGMIVEFLKDMILYENPTVLISTDFSKPFEQET